MASFGCFQTSKRLKEDVNLQKPYLPAQVKFTGKISIDVLFKKSCGKISKGVLVSGNMSKNKIPK